SHAAVGRVRSRCSSNPDLGGSRWAYPRCEAGARWLASAAMGGGRFRAFFRVLITGAVVAGAILSLAGRAGGAPAPDPKQAANQAAALRQQLEARYDQLGDRVSEIQLKIDALEARRRELRATAGQRA